MFGLFKLIEWIDLIFLRVRWFLNLVWILNVVFLILGLFRFISMIFELVFFLIVIFCTFVCVRMIGIDKVFFSEKILIKMYLIFN